MAEDGMKFVGKNEQGGSIYSPTHYESDKYLNKHRCSECFINNVPVRVFFKCPEFWNARFLCRNCGEDFKEKGWEVVDASVSYKEKLISSMCLEKLEE